MQVRKMSSIAMGLPIAETEAAADFPRGAIKAAAKDAKLFDLPPLAGETYLPQNKSSSS
jgi:hypothetical protein